MFCLSPMVPHSYVGRMSGLFSLCEARSIREECSEASVILVANISSVKAYTGLALQMFSGRRR